MRHARFLVASAFGSLCTWGALHIILRYLLGRSDGWSPSAIDLGIGTIAAMAATRALLRNARPKAGWATIAATMLAWLVTMLWSVYRYFSRHEGDAFEAFAITVTVIPHLTAGIFASGVFWAPGVLLMLPNQVPADSGRSSNLQQRALRWFWAYWLPADTRTDPGLFLAPILGSFVTWRVARLAIAWSTGYSSSLWRWSPGFVEFANGLTLAVLATYAASRWLRTSTAASSIWGTVAAWTTFMAWSIARAFAEPRPVQSDDFIRGGIVATIYVVFAAVLWIPITMLVLSHLRSGAQAERARRATARGPIGGRVSESFSTNQEVSTTVKA